MTHDLWANLNSRMFDYLNSVTLADLVEQQRVKARSKDGAVVVVHDNRPQRAAKVQVAVNGRSQGT